MLLQVLPLGRTRTVDADISKFFRELLSWKTVLEFNNHVPSILRTNFDGLHYSSESNRIDFHTQIFRNGGVEFFSSFLFHKDTAGDYIIFQDNFSSWIANAGNGAIKFLQTQSQVEPSYIVMLTLIDVDNLPIRHDKLISFTPRGFQQRDLKFTPLVIDEAGDDEVCRVLDQISEFAFQAAGLSGK